jgi:hypothetical protein
MSAPLSCSYCLCPGCVPLAARLGPQHTRVHAHVAAVLKAATAACGACTPARTVRQTDQFDCALAVPRWLPDIYLSQSWTTVPAFLEAEAAARCIWASS